MSSQSKSSDRRNAAVISETATDKADRQELKGLKTDLQTIIDGWDAATNAQRFNWTKDATKIIKKVIKVMLG